MRPLLRPVARSRARLRLTLAYAALFLVGGVILLGTSYVVVRAQFAPTTLTEAPTSRPLPGPPSGTTTLIPPSQADLDRVQRFVVRRNREALRRVLLYFAAALAGTTLASLALGWFVAGRILRPVARITATARRVSRENLGERIALDGPQDELKELADTFDAMLEQLDRAFESQRLFIAQASHELRTPLAVMRAALDVTLEDPGATREDVEAMAATLREAIDGSERLVERLLVLASSDRGLEHREPVALHRCASGVLAARRAQAAARGLDVTADLDAVTVPGDPVLLGQLLANLVDNGIRHNRDGGSLHVRCAPVDGAVEVLVAADGARLAPAALPELLAPFRRPRPAGGPTGEGFGLGLSIVDAVARAHGGSVALAARPGGGLEVRVRLPSMEARHASAGVDATGRATQVRAA